MKTLNAMLDEYLELRRAVGFKLKKEESLLRNFVAFLKKKNTSRITTALALQFACGVETRSPVTNRGYLSAIRGFALYLGGMGFPSDDIPAGLLRRHRSRTRPYIYTDKKVEQLLALAWNPPVLRGRFKRHALKPWTLHTLFGLLAVTGMRVGEALSLKLGDVDWNECVIRISLTKFLKSRLVPVHSTTLERLRAYARKRECCLAARRLPSQPWFFVTCQGNALKNNVASRDFQKLLHHAGLRKPGDKHGPRLHDLRHRFAVITLLRWYESGKVDGNLMPILSTYLGHGQTSATYWYLSNTPELMAAAKKRLEKRWEGGA